LAGFRHANIVPLIGASIERYISKLHYIVGNDYHYLEKRGV